VAALPLETPQGETHEVNAIELSGLRKSFGSCVAIDGVSLRVRPGEVVALLGPNGAGKSTIIEIVLGLVRPESGTARLWGLSPSKACATGRVGAMLQNGGLLGGLTVRQSIEVFRGLSSSPLALDDVLAMAGLADVASHRADRLSGGETQRLRFAFAIAGDPGLLVLDEPTGAMDVTTRRTFWSTIRAWADGSRTVMFATHHLDEADAHADRVVLFSKGRVVADGPTAEVRAIAHGRTIRASISGTNEVELRSLPGVSSVDQRGDVVALRCTDSDSALRGLLARWPEARDIEVAGAGMEDAFIALTEGEAVL
jgi:ABC-2 type transport system ATP-binding protein